MPRDLHVRRFALVSALFGLAACDPLTCQGRVDHQGKIVVKDAPFFPPLCVGSASEFNGDVDVTQQAQLDALADCQRVKGNIFIHDSDDITNLGALAKLQRIDQGYLLVLNNRALTEVALPGLTEVQNGIGLIDNPELVRVLMPGITTLKGDLTIRNDAKLTQLDFKAAQRLNNAVFFISGQNVVTSFGNLILADLPALTSIDGAFDALQVIEGALDVHNTGLTSFKGLENLTQILNAGGAGTVRTAFRADKLNPGLSVGIDFNDRFDVVPSPNPALRNFDGLQNLDAIGGDIFIGFNPELENFAGLDDLTTINGRLFVVGNDKLANFSGLDGDNNGDGNDDGLSTINGDLFIGLFFDRFGQPKAGGNARLVDFSGLDSLTTLTGNLTLAFSPAFEDFTGLDRLPAIGGSFTMLGLKPKSFKGALALTTIGGNLSFGQLFRLDGQPFDPREAVPENQLTDVNGVRQDPAVKFDSNNGQNGFDALTTVNGDLVFAFSDFDANAGALRLSDPDTATLATVGGSLILYGNKNPDSLDGIQGITSLGGFVVNFAVDAFGDLQPFENNGLADFSALLPGNNGSLGAGGLHIGFNRDLDNAAFATFNDFVNVAGDVTIARVGNQNNLGPTDLNELNITTIGGNLTICAVKNGDNAPINANLGNLTALNINATTTIGGDLFVGFCSNLSNTAMSTAAVAGTVEFTELPRLQTLNGLNFNTIGALQLHDLTDLATINIPSLTQVDGNLEIVRNRRLTDITFNLANVGGNLRLVDLGELPDLDGFSGLNTVGGDLDIVDCDALANTNGLNQLDEVVGTLRLRRLDTITNQARAGGLQELSFNQLLRVGGLDVAEMNDLEDLAGFQTLTEVRGIVSIARNRKLKTLFGLQGLTRIGRKLSIVDNPVLGLAFFDDDNQDREPDRDDGDGNNNEPEDPDNTFESGLLETLATIGEPIIENGVLIGGQTGVIELRNNPRLDESSFFDEFIDRLDNYEGLIFLCGNDGSEDRVDAARRLTSFAACASAQDGLDFGAEPPPDQ
jgi:hypothetical protein